MGLGSRKGRGTNRHGGARSASPFGGGSQGLVAALRRIVSVGSSPAPELTDTQRCLGSREDWYRNRSKRRTEDAIGSRFAAASSSGDAILGGSRASSRASARALPGRASATPARATLERPALGRPGL
jgi:hypothetical protein